MQHTLNIISSMYCEVVFIATALKIASVSCIYQCSLYWNDL